MTSLTSLHQAFQYHHMTLVRDEQQDSSAVFIIDASTRLCSRIAIDIILSSGHAPLLSANRINGNLMFTVVPYRKPPAFDKQAAPKIGIDSTALWEQISSIPDPFAPETIIHASAGESLTAQKAQDYITQGCNQISSLMVEFADSAPQGGRAADLGCGRGVNAWPLLEKNWRVTAIDQRDVVLELFRQRVKDEPIDYLATQKLQLIQADITTYPLESEAFDLILAVDVLPYIPPKKLQGLLQKIHRALRPNGLFMGTWMFSMAHLPQQQRKLERYFGKIGIRCCPNEALALSMLEHSGFSVIDWSQRWDAYFDVLGLKPMWAQFLVQKRALPSAGLEEELR